MIGAWRWAPDRLIFRPCCVKPGRLASNGILSKRSRTRHWRIFLRSCAIWRAFGFEVSKRCDCKRSQKTFTLSYFDWSNACRAVVRRAIDRARHRDRLQFIRFVRPHQSQEVVGFAVRIDPCRFVFGSKDRGHPVMNSRDQFIRLDRDDRAGFHRLSLRRSPSLPQPREGEQSAVAPANIDRLARRLAPLLPFKEAVGRNQTSPLGEGLFEGWFFLDRLGLGVDQVVSDLRVFGPIGNQPPFATSHLAQVLARLRAPNHRNDLRRRDVVARGEDFLDRLDAEPLRYFFWRVMKCVSSAHSPQFTSKLI